MSCKADMLQLFKTIKNKVCYWLFPIINVWYKMHIKYSAMHNNIDAKKNRRKTISCRRRRQMSIINDR